MKKFIWVLIVVILIILGAVWHFYSTEEKSLQAVNSFEDCAENGYPVMESSPRQCKTPDGRNFVEEPVSPVPSTDTMVHVTIPQSGAFITSPLTIIGEARGNWYFEASFPITLESTSGQVLAQTVAQAQGEWMTTDFVPFTATLIFDLPVPAVAKPVDAFLVFHKDNPSGLPENDDSFKLPVKYGNAPINMESQDNL